MLLYRALLQMYPRGFRAEFGWEMQQVFSEALEGAAGRGLFPHANALFREYLDLPLNALRQHLKLTSDTVAWRSRPSRGEILVALMFFIIPSIYIFLNTNSGQPAYLILMLIGVAIFVIIVAGFLKGFPRWSMPYLGLALSLISFLIVFQWVTDFISPKMMVQLGPIPIDESSRLILQAFWAGLLWLSLMIFTLLVFGSLALVRMFKPLLESIREDWTLVSYILYYGATFTLFLAYDLYRGHQTFVLASAICLGCGAWFYLHAEKSWQRILALICGLSLAMLAAMAARWSFLPDRNALSSPLAMIIDPIHWPGAIWSPFDWAWIVLILIAPVLLRLLEKGSWRHALKS